MFGPFTLLVKPAGPDCNIACQYCFYTCKTDFFGGRVHRMSDAVLEQLVKSYLNLGFEQSHFAWQGGEPTLMGLDFYKRLVELQFQCAESGRIITNALQTNGILLDERWCRFLTDHHFLCGISLDGPKKYHDMYRKDRSGNGTFDRVMKGMENCHKYDTQFNILVLLNDVNIRHPDELFDFYTGMGIHYLQFVPCVEKSPDDPQEAAPYSITPREYGQFLCRLFDRWIDYGFEKLSIRLFDTMLSFLMGRPHTECTFARRCADYIVIEHNGDAYCCDFYVTNETKLGNIMDTPIEKLANSQLKREFAQKKMEINNKCLICRYLDICRGGCPKNRAILTGTHKAPSYFCEGYKMFFAHALPRLQMIARDIQTGKYAN